jgi:hypothetical protein
MHPKEIAREEEEEEVHHHHHHHHHHDEEEAVVQETPKSAVELALQQLTIDSTDLDPTDEVDDLVSVCSMRCSR